MPRLNIIRAWKDETYRRGLGAAQRALLPDNPAGLIELTDADLGAILGGDEWRTQSDGCLWGAFANVTAGCP
jgi:mersacidin/lichenicidin family type 2 lantibiotic